MVESAQPEPLIVQELLAALSDRGDKPAAGSSPDKDLFGDVFDAAEGEIPAVPVGTKKNQGTIMKVLEELAKVWKMVRHVKLMTRIHLGV